MKPANNKVSTFIIEYSTKVEKLLLFSEVKTIGLKILIKKIALFGKA
jgi:hypothetical protein